MDPVTLLEQMRARGVDVEPTLIGDLTANAVNIGNAEFLAKAEVGALKSDATPEEEQDHQNQLSPFPWLKCIKKH